MQKRRQRSLLLFWGKNLVNSLPRQLFCLGRFRRIGWIHPFVSNHPGAIHPIIVQCKTATTARNKFFPTNRTDNICLVFCLYPSSMFPKLSLHCPQKTNLGLVWHTDGCARWGQKIVVLQYSNSFYIQNMILCQPSCLYFYAPLRCIQYIHV